MVSAERESRSAVAGSDCAFGERVVAALVFLDEQAIFEKLYGLLRFFGGDAGVYPLCEGLVVAVKTEHAYKAADDEVSPVRIHHILSVSEQLLFFGKSHDLEYGLHLVKCSVPFFGGFGLVELDEGYKEFRLVLAESKPACNFRNALARKVLVAVHDAADEIFRLETDLVRKYAEREGRVGLFLCVVVIFQKFPVVQVFEDFFCRFWCSHALNVRKKPFCGIGECIIALSENNAKLRSVEKYVAKIPVLR